MKNTIATIAIIAFLGLIYVVLQGNSIYVDSAPTEKVDFQPEEVEEVAESVEDDIDEIESLEADVDSQLEELENLDF